MRSITTPCMVALPSFLRRAATSFKSFRWVFCDMRTRADRLIALAAAGAGAAYCLWITRVLQMCCGTVVAPVDPQIL